jgi:hypothetical protein
MIILDESFDVLELIYIDVCSYIGTFVYITDIGKLADIYEDIANMIDTDKIVIKNIYIIITKLCILCDIYNKHPVAKCGNMSIALLKNKIAHILNANDMKLSQNGIMRFDGILPPHNHENYNTALGIIAIIIKTIKTTDDLSGDGDDIDKLVGISNNLRLVIDYILRKKIKIETKFYSTDDDISWFIWGVYSILYKDKVFENAFKLYNHEYKKKYKIKRQGLLYSLGLLCIYIHKQDISKGWTSKERNVIDKIDEISIKLYNEIRRDIISKYPELSEKTNKHTREEKIRENDGLNFMLNYVPEIDSSNADKQEARENKMNYAEIPRVIET